MSNESWKLSRTASTLLAIVFLSMLYSCGGSGLPENNGGVAASIGTGSGSGAATAANMEVTATPSTITTGTTSSIKAAVTTSTGGNVADGTAVSFTLSSSAMGTITSQAITSNGVASVTFTASTVPGTVTVTAKVGSLSNTAVIIISAPATGNVEFVSASPQKIGIKGSGQASTSTIKFLVKDINGNPAIDGTSVSFAMVGPGGGKLPSAGGEYIGDPDTTPTTASASTVSGYASTTLNSGSVAGTVTIAASVTSGSQVFSASSSAISIGGGLPSASHFNIATTKVNLPGLVWSNKTADISAFIADRFGNYNVLKSTTVSFYAEAGAIDSSNVTDESGLTTVKFRTQWPIPVNVTPAVAGDPVSNAFFNDLSEPSATTYNPRDGWATILATVQGEEGFEDINGNGIYDAGEKFTDTGEPFIDKNDDGCWNSGTIKNCNGVVSASTDPFEEFIDANGNGVYDGANGVWDGPGCSVANCLTSKTIWVSLRLVFSGNPVYCDISPSTPFTITNGSSQAFTFTLGDENMNWLPSGTTVSISATIGTLSGTTSHTLTDRLSKGPLVISFVLTDADTDTTVDASTLTVTVTPTEGLTECKDDAVGTVQ
ncbi:MAG: hypothetical protein AABY54_01745 [Deltaproteobacteria bacterium]